MIMIFGYCTDCDVQVCCVAIRIAVIKQYLVRFENCEFIHSTSCTLIDKEIVTEDRTQCSQSICNDLPGTNEIPSKYTEPFFTALQRTN
jgi:hypothetical protein